MSTPQSAMSDAAITGAFMRECIVSGMTLWIKVYSFFYGGEVYEYAYEVGPNSDTLKNAEDLALRKAFALRAQLNFLRDATLETKQ